MTLPDGRVLPTGWSGTIGSSWLQPGSPPVPNECDDPVHQRLNTSGRCLRPGRGTHGDVELVARCDDLEQRELDRAVDSDGDRLLSCLDAGVTKGAPVELSAGRT
jgi:hypothetical protein